MSGPVTRKIELARQIEEMTLLLGEQRTELPSRQRRDRIPAGIVQERLQRQAAILETLKWCRDHEHEVRQWAADRKGKTDDHQSA